MRKTHFKTASVSETSQKGARTLQGNGILVNEREILTHTKTEENEKWPGKEKLRRYKNKIKAIG